MARPRSPNRLPDTQQRALGLDSPPMPKPAPSKKIEPVATRFAEEREIWLGNVSLDAYLESIGQWLALELNTLVDELDLSMLCEAQEVGRRPIHPRVFIKLISLGLLQGRSSLRQLETLARVDLCAMYLCGGHQPDHATIGRFIAGKQGTKDKQDERLEKLFVEITGALAKRLRIKAGQAALDGTIVQAVASNYRTMKLEAARELAAELAQKAAQDPENARLEKSSALAAEAVERGAQRAEVRESKGKPGSVRVSPTEPEAVLQPLKQGGMAPAYKPSVIAHESGLICGQAVDPTSETAVVGKLFDQHEKVLGAKPETAMADAGYCNEKPLNEAIERDIDLLVPSGRESAPDMKRVRKDGLFVKEDFVHDEPTDTYRCPAGKSLVVVGRTTDQQGRTVVKYAAGATTCSTCPLKPKCTRAATREFKRYPIDDLKEAMAGIMRHPQARERYAHRKVIVETRFADLKVRQGLRRFRRRGLLGVRVEFALHCLAYNLGFAARRLHAQLARALRGVLWLVTATLVARRRSSAPNRSMVAAPL